jgi:hypothetical protein
MHSSFVSVRVSFWYSQQSVSIRTHSRMLSETNNTHHLFAYKNNVMRNNIIILLLVVVVLAGCRSNRSLVYSSNAANIAVIKIEFRNESGVIEKIKQQLNSSRVLEMKTEHYGATEIIVARYDNIPGGRAREIELALTQIKGVIEVTLQWEELPVRDSRPRVPRFAS